MSTTNRAIACALALVCARPAAAAPPAGEPATIEAALSAGDLASARSLVEAARIADPSPALWQREAELCTRLADLACARAAWQGHLAALPKGADRGPGEAGLAAIEEMSRGTVGDEPTSTHRAELDAARAAREAALLPKPAISDAPPPKPAPRRERIVTKWYFWVTTLAIAAAAGAITGIAIQAARDEQPDALDQARSVAPPQGLGLRF